MKRAIQAAAIIIAAFAAAITIGGCRRNNDDDRFAGFFFWVTSGVDTTINPHDSAALANSEIVDLIVLPLYGWTVCRESGRESLVPRVALGEPVSEDGVHWNIRINPDARWSNGTFVTAHDFIFSWQMGLSPLLSYTAAAQIYGNRVEVLGAEAYFTQRTYGDFPWESVGMRAVDDHTIEIITARLYTPFDVMLHFSHRATAPVYRPLYEAGMNEARTSTLYGTSLDYFMGNGPFILTSWTRGSERIFERNPYHLFPEEIHINGIHGRVAQDEITRIELFMSGQSDFIELGAAGLLMFEEDPRLVSFERQIIRSIEANRSNPNHPILADPVFRAALYYATDRAQIASLINAAPAPFFLSTLGVSFADGTTFREMPEANEWIPKNYGFDPDLARDLMSQAFEVYNITSLSLTLAYGQDIPGLRAASELIQHQWEQVFGGDMFSLTLRPMPHSAVLDLMRTSRNAPTTGWDLAWSGIFPRAEFFSPHEKFRPYLSTATGRFTNYTNNQLDALFPLFSEDSHRLDERARFELTVELEHYFILEDVTLIPVFQERAFVLWNSRISLPMGRVSPVIGFGWMFGEIEE